MIGTKNEADWEYRTLLIIWAASFSTPFLFALCLYFIQPNAFHFNHSQPFIGERYIVVPIAIGLSIWDLCFSYYRRNSYLKLANINKDTELVRTGLITATASTISIALYGFFLAWIFDYAYWYLWFVVSVFATTFHFPRRSTLATVRA